MDTNRSVIIKHHQHLNVLLKSQANSVALTAYVGVKAAPMLGCRYDLCYQHAPRASPNTTTVRLPREAVVEGRQQVTSGKCLRRVPCKRPSCLIYLGNDTRQIAEEE